MENFVAWTLQGAQQVALQALQAPWILLLTLLIAWVTWKYCQMLRVYFRSVPSLVFNTALWSSG